MSKRLVHYGYVHLKINNNKLGLYSVNSTVALTLKMKNCINYRLLLNTKTRSR